MNYLEDITAPDVLYDINSIFLYTCFDERISLSRWTCNPTPSYYKDTCNKIYDYLMEKTKDNRIINLDGPSDMWIKTFYVIRLKTYSGEIVFSVALHPALPLHALISRDRYVLNTHMGIKYGSHRITRSISKVSLHGRFYRKMARARKKMTRQQRTMKSLRALYYEFITSNDITDLDDNIVKDLWNPRMDAIHQGKYDKQVYIKFLDKEFGIKV